MSNIYKTSTKFRENVQLQIENLNSEQKTYQARLLETFQAIRCQVGLYCMETRAKLTLIDTIIQGVVFVILLKM
jgi:hypothetical protein